MKSASKKRIKKEHVFGHKRQVFDFELSGTKNYIFYNKHSHE